MLSAGPPAGGVADRPAAEERLIFQTARPWSPGINLNADAALVYGIDASLPDRLASWRDRGYIPHVMTGAAWGEYADYYYGDWDGADHTDAIQREIDGDRIAHGRDNFYVCPTVEYADYLAAGVRRALDAGAVAVHLEEPEYWVRAGYSEAFKREWREYYGEPWVDPVSSPDAQYRASKLKHFLYRRTLARVFDAVHQREREAGREIPCYVPTHALINYASFGIVSPGASLLDVGCDGFVAQTWTGTAREPNHYGGVRKERTFETAFLEYASMQNLVRASGKPVWFLNDPIEDDPQHSWADYRTNWESTLIASLLQPEVFRFEAMPWPHRVFHGRPAGGGVIFGAGPQAVAAGHDPAGLCDGVAGRHHRAGRPETAGRLGGVGRNRQPGRGRCGVGHDHVPAVRAGPHGPRPRLVPRPRPAVRHGRGAGRAGADRDGRTRPLRHAGPQLRGPETADGGVPRRPRRLGAGGAGRWR